MLGVKYERMDAEQLSTYIEIEEVNVNDLFLNKKNQREAFFKAIKKRPVLLTKIKKENEDHFLVPVMEKDPSYFIYFKKEQYKEEYAQKFLSYRLNQVEENAKGKTEKRDPSLVVQSSMDNKVLLNYNFVAKDEDEVNYFDNELHVPVSIKANFKTTLKIVDALKMINKMDLHITQLGKNKIETTITDLLDSKFKVYLSEYIVETKAGYYSLCANIGDIEEEFKKLSSVVFAEYGIEVCEFIIKRFAIPKDIQYKIEDQAFQIRQLKAENQASNEIAKKSLENYEAKLAIESKYPEVEHTLTEYEKDLALKRFLIKTGRSTEEEINHFIGTKITTEKTDVAMDKKNDVVPEAPKRLNVFKTAYFTLLIICAFIDIILLSSNVGVALILMGVFTLVFGVVGIICSEKLKGQKNEIVTAEEKTTLLNGSTSQENSESADKK